MTTLILSLIACSDTLQERTANADEAAWPDQPDLDTAILDELDAAHVPGLAACAFSAGEVTWCQGYGWADVDDLTPATTATPFLVASVSKTVVASAALLAAEEGLLDLDEPVAVGFDVRHPDATGTPITPRMLASHTSGIADDWDTLDESYSDGDSSVPLGEFLESYLVAGGSRQTSGSWGSAPGTDLDYSNVAVALLAYAVEVAVGQPFQDYCRDRIFSPLGMADTAWHLDDLAAEPAMPTTWSLGQYRSEGHYGFPDYPSGQLRTSAEDLARYVADAQAHGPDALFESQTGLDPEQGFVWYRWNQNGETIWGHNGGEVGVSAEVGFTGSGDGFVVLMNGEGRGSTLGTIEAAILGAF
jgi:CubicO group peptidase (beta-lactamase class C family)